MSYYLITFLSSDGPNQYDLVTRPLQQNRYFGCAPSTVGPTFDDPNRHNEINYQPSHNPPKPKSLQPLHFLLIRVGLKPWYRTLINRYVPKLHDTGLSPPSQLPCRFLSSSTKRNAERAPAINVSGTHGLIRWYDLNRACGGPSVDFIS